jgi:hypothetical protein
VAVEGLDAGPPQAGDHIGVQVGGDRDELGLAGALERFAHEPLVGPPGVEQRAPGLDAPGDRHA